MKQEKNKKNNLNIIPQRKMINMSMKCLNALQPPAPATDVYMTYDTNFYCKRI